MKSATLTESQVCQRPTSPSTTQGTGAPATGQFTVASYDSDASKFARELMELPLSKQGKQSAQAIVGELKSLSNQGKYSLTSTLRVLGGPKKLGKVRKLTEALRTECAGVAAKLHAEICARELSEKRS